MKVRLGYFELDEEKEKKKMALKNLRKEIVIEDEDVCDNFDCFVEFACVELSMQGLKYGEKYRNSLNGLLFKQSKPHYVGKLRCIIRMNKEDKEEKKLIDYSLMETVNYNGVNS